MLSIDLIRENLKRSEEIVLARIEEMQEHCMVLSTPQGGCHTLWIIGHLAYIEALVNHSIMLGTANPLAEWEKTFDAAEVSQESNHFPPFDRVLQECRRMRASTISLLDSLTEDDLDRASENVPNGAEGLFATYRHCFQYTVDHWYMHRGQLADARHAAGIDRMWY
jgi:hypothetical protein